MEGRCIEKKAYTLFLSPLCRLIWPASISPERLLRAGSEPIYPRATLTKTVGPFRHVPGWGSPLPCCPAFCIIRLEQLFDNWSKCAWYVSYTRGFDQRNGWEFSPFSLSSTFNCHRIIVSPSDFKFQQFVLEWRPDGSMARRLGRINPACQKLLYKHPISGNVYIWLLT